MIEPKDWTLRNIRERANINQKQLAARLHLDASIPSYKERRFMFDEHTVEFLRSWVEACGGKLRVVIEINNETIVK